MSRIFSKNDNPHKPEINPESVVDFFEQRAEKAGTLGYTQAVIYQDKHPDLASKRDSAEKNKLLPKLKLTGNNRILDIGCGTGRWTDVLTANNTGQSGHYHGIDISPSLIEIAKSRYGERENTAFSVLSLDRLAPATLCDSEQFDRVCCFGTLIYLNDTALNHGLQGIAKIIRPDGRFLLREPVAVERRLTLDEYFSDEMGQTYSAIYRPQDELISMAERSLAPVGLSLIDSGDVYAATELNNRTETIQRWFLFGPQQ